MDPGGVITGAATILFVAFIAYGLWCHPLKPWIEERRWQRDEHRAAEQIRLDRSGSRLVTLTEAFEDMQDELQTAFDEVFPGLLLDDLEAAFALPCAPNPSRRTA
jgi:hypothetical protein